MPPAQKTKPAVKAASPETILKKVDALLADAALEELTTTVAGQIAQLVGAAAVRVYLRDALTDELHCMVPTNKGLRELRLPPDATSVVGYSAMTNTRAFAWMGELPNRRNVVAVPLATDVDLLGVIEIIHAQPNVTFDDAMISGFDSLARAFAARIKAVGTVAVRSTPYDHLMKARYLTQEQLRDARVRASSGGRSVEMELLASGIDKAALGKSLADYFRCAFVENPGALPLDAELARRFSSGFLRSNAVLPVALKGRSLEAVVANPRNLTLQDDLSRQCGGASLSLRVGVREEIAAALEKILPTPVVASPAAAPEPEPVAEIETTEPKFQTQGVRDWDLAPSPKDDGNVKIDSSTVRLVNDTIRAAIAAGASDIHWESLDNGGLIIRLRVDGILHDHQAIKEPVARGVVSRLKIMSELDIAEHRLPQDGKIRMKD